MKRSYSQYRTFSECPRKWELSRKWEPKRKAAALNDGDCWHKVLAKFYGTSQLALGLAVLEDHFANVAPYDTRDADALKNKKSHMIALATTYWEHVATNDIDQFEVLGVEMPFKVQLDRGLVLEGYVDAVFKHKKSGITFIVEHKHQQDLSDELMALDLQVSLYTFGLAERFGILPTLYNVCRKPMYKRSDKKGETEEQFRDRVAESIKEESREIKWAYDGFDSRFHVRRAYTRGKSDLEAAVRQARVMAKLMRKIEKDPCQVWRNVGEHCLYRCSFRDICIVEDPIVIDERYDPKATNVPAPKAGGPVI